MISGSCKKVLMSVLLAMGCTTVMAFEDAFFARKGKFKCSSMSRCHVPTIDEIEWIKNEFKNKSVERVFHLNQFEEKASRKVENILWRSQESELQTNEENNFSEFYKNIGSFLDKKFGSMKIETAKVILSEGSPFIMELEDLQGVLTGVLTQRDQEKISDQEKYYNWYNRPAFQQLLKEMVEVREKFFLNKSLDLDSSEKVALMPFELVTCPKKLKGLISKRFFQEDLNKNKDFYQRVLGLKEKLITIKCSPHRSKRRTKLKSRYLKSTREIILPYQVGKRRSVSPVKKMFDKVK